MSDAFDKSDDKYKQFLDSHPDPFIAYDKKGRVTYLNPAFTRVFKWTLEEQLGKKMDQFVPPENWPETQKMIDKMLAGKSVTGQETCRYSKDGHIIAVSLSAATYSDENGNMLGSLVTLQDISERKISEENLYKINKKYEALMEASPDPMCAYSASGEVEYINPAFEKIFGWTLNDVLGKGIDFIPEKEKQKTADGVKRMLEGESVLLDTRRYTKNGDLLEIQLNTANYYDQHGDFAGNIVIYRDMTRRVAYEEKIKKLNEELESRVVERTRQLEATNLELKEATLQARLLAQKADAANIAKSDFLANMSHELRTPLNGIIASADLTLTETLSPEIEKHTHHILHSGQALLSIIDDILSFSSIEFDHSELITAPFSIEKIFDHIDKNFVHTANEKKLRLSWKKQQGLPENYTGDFPKLLFAINNIVDNAIKFTNPGGSVAIEINAKRTTEKSDHLYLEFSIRDTGIGIHPKYINNLFDAFTQEDTSSTRKYGGVGLGLTLTKKVLDKINGQICVESQPGKGTTVLITCPLKLQFKKSNKQDDSAYDRQQNDADEIRRYKKNIADSKILVVEDNPLNQKIIERILNKASLTPTIVNNGKEAVSATTEQNFDAILMDIQMPVMDGHEATRRIRRTFKKGELPIIAVTANATKKDMEKCKAAGMDSFITKPIKPITIYKALSDHIKNKQNPGVST